MCYIFGDKNAEYNIYKCDFTPKHISKNALYITGRLCNSIKHKHSPRHAYVKDETDENKHKCRTFNNKLTSLLRTREQDYIEEQLDLYKTGMSMSWKVIQEIIDKVKISITHQNENPTVNKSVISNSFNNHFIHVEPRLVKQIQGHINPLNE